MRAEVKKAAVGDYLMVGSSYVQVIYRSYDSFSRHTHVHLKSVGPTGQAVNHIWRTARRINDLPRLGYKYADSAFYERMIAAGYMSHAMLQDLIDCGKVSDVGVECLES